MNLQQLIKSVQNNLSYRAISDKERIKVNQILSAMRVVDRQYFVPDRTDAYFDTAMPIGYNQTISQPSTVARMLMLADLDKGKDLLELGAGSGWNASLAGFIVYPGKVLSLDIVPQLVENALQNLNEVKMHLNYKDRKKLSHIEFKHENIFNQLTTWQVTYDRIIITAGITESQEKIIHKLAHLTLNEKGILVCPHTYGPLITLKKEKGEIIKNTTLEQYVFVPLLD